MKALIYPLIGFTLLLVSCKKSLDTSPVGTWLLVKRTGGIGPNPTDIKPAIDSIVSLTLNLAGTYTSSLNNTVIASGDYHIDRSPVAPDNQRMLELENFRPTGIFYLFTVYQLGSNGAVVSVYDEMTIEVSGNTMTLTGMPTPAGEIRYLFVRR